jgi:hypothetical protein
METAQLSFAQQLRAARSAQKKSIKNMLEALSPDERIYLGMVPGADQETVGEASKINDAEMRRAKRKALDESHKKNIEDAKANKELKKAEEKRLFKEAQQQSQLLKAANRAAAKSAKIKKKDKPGAYLDHIRVSDIKIAPKAFEPIIGQPNAKGETPVEVEPKLWIYVKPGHDINARIARFQENRSLANKKE